MDSKAEQLRAMREAQANGTEPGEKTNVLPAKVVKNLGSPPKRAKKAAPKSKKGSAERFKPNKTKGRPPADKAHLSNEARAPWEDLGMSRRTWYRRLAEGTVPK